METTQLEFKKFSTEVVHSTFSVGTKWSSPFPISVFYYMTNGYNLQTQFLAYRPLQAVLRSRILSDPDLFAGSGSGNFTTGSGSSSGSFKKISVSVQYRAYVYLFTP